MSTLFMIVALLISVSVVFLAGLWTGRRIEHARYLAQEEVVWNHVAQTIGERTARREADLFINGGSNTDPITARGLAKAFHVPEELLVNPNDLPHWQDLNKARSRREPKS